MPTQETPCMAVCVLLQPHLYVEQDEGMVQQVRCFTGSTLLAFVRLQCLAQLPCFLSHLQTHSGHQTSTALALNHVILGDRHSGGGGGMSEPGL